MGVSKKTVRSCGRRKKCSFCDKIDAVLHEIMIGEEIIDHFGYQENEKLHLDSLKSRNYKNPKTWEREVKRRLGLIKRDKAGEELPAELSMIFEKMEEKLKSHPPTED